MKLKCINCNKEFVKRAWNAKTCCVKIAKRFKEAV